MANVLFLVHRLPYPPNKGDKVRSYHLLRHLAEQHRVFLGTFVDDADDEAHVESVRAICEDVYVVRLRPFLARLASLSALLSYKPLTLDYYRHSGLSKWVGRLPEQHAIDAVVVFSSSMAQFAPLSPDIPVFVDFVDMDSAKWTSYAGQRWWPLSWLYRREGARLLTYERTLAAQVKASFFVTEQEATLFRNSAPECSEKVEAMCNGVDSVYFCPDPKLASPYAADELPLVFTGAMDYWPNIDAVTWFSREVMPLLRAKLPRMRLHIVGRNPTASVRELANDGVVVSGTVADVRPYLQHAKVVVAPLRLARGVQNKILEAMAMGRPVVAAAACVDVLNATPGVEVIPASSKDDYVGAIYELICSPKKAAAMGRAGRKRVMDSYSWSAHLSRIDQHLAAAAVVQDAA